MKKIISLFLVLALMLCFAACQDGDGETIESKTEADSTDIVTTQPVATETEKSDNEGTVEDDIEDDVEETETTTARWTNNY